MDEAELTTENVLKRDVHWESYMTHKMITLTCLGKIRRYDNQSESHKAALLDDDGAAYVKLFVDILRNNPFQENGTISRYVFKKETVEYVLALIDEMLTGNTCLLWKGNWFIQNKSCKILSAIISARPRNQSGLSTHVKSSHSKVKSTSIDDVLKGLMEWVCAQLKYPSHPSRGIPSAISRLSTLLKEPSVKSSFVQSDGVKLLIPMISPATTQKSVQLLYETCLCIWLLSYYEPAVRYLASSRTLLRLVDVVKSSTKEKVVRVVVLILKNLLSKGTLGPKMVVVGLPQIVQNLKARAWNDEDLLEGLNQLEEGLKNNIKEMSSFDKYKQEVLLGHLDWSPMHKDPMFWRENIFNFEDNDFQILRVLITILSTSSDPRALAIVCNDLSQFIQHHSSGRLIVNDLKAKEGVMKLINHENTEVTLNALLCIQRLLLGAKFAGLLLA
ncbi:hypothetical protein MKW92_029702 [Papaver armeniacum]|nr:hypothetical protein MKW92_029702 [Papaver armeniacum]